MVPAAPTPRGAVTALLAPARPQLALIPPCGLQLTDVAGRAVDLGGGGLVCARTTAEAKAASHGADRLHLAIVGPRLSFGPVRHKKIVQGRSHRNGQADAGLDETSEAVARPARASTRPHETGARPKSGAAFLRPPLALQNHRLSLSRSL